MKELLTNEERLSRLRARWKRQQEDRKLGRHKTMIRTVDNLTCGVPEKPEPNHARLKLEVGVAIDKNFWGNPSKPWRPKTDPAKGGGFVNYSRKNFTTPPTAGVFGGTR